MGCRTDNFAAQIFAATKIYKVVAEGGTKGYFKTVNVTVILGYFFLRLYFTLANLLAPISSALAALARLTTWVIVFQIKCFASKFCFFLEQWEKSPNARMT